MPVTTDQPTAPPTTAAPTTPVAPSGPTADDTDALVLDSLLVEDVSIDGMCGVY